MKHPSSIRFIKSVAHISQLPEIRRPEIAVIGRSNVGKSTFINTLFNRKNIARVSSSPGKTQHLNFFLVSDHYYLVDLPGYGYKKLPVAATRHWPVLIETYLRNSAQLKLIFLLIDSRHDPQEIDHQMISWLKTYGRPFQIILTKKDKLSNNQFAKQIAVFSEQFYPIPMIAFSSKTREGKDPVLQQIETAVSL
jgi:GTP-binding protein